jgi:mannose-6-phosphate isomerase-like protein (cupin superfamily)
MEVQHVREVLDAAPELVIGPATTGEDARSTVRDFGTFDEHHLSGRRWQGLSPWERHPDGEELLIPLHGEVELTLLVDGSAQKITLSAGSVFVVPRGVWHRQFATETVYSFGVNSLGEDEISFADNPLIDPS